MPNHAPDIDLEDDTIAAICTGVGGAITVIRLSGPRALAVLRQVWRGPRTLAARRLVLGRLLAADGQPIDHCLAVHMPGPRSYTGEDVVELQLHGGVQVARTALQRLLQAGCRHAEPGEFTRRAFLHGRLDLTQAEAVLDTIRAQSDMALHTAARQLDGHLHDRVDAAYTSVTHVLAEVEVQLDFVDEDLDFSRLSDLVERLRLARQIAVDLLRHRQHGAILRQGVRLVLAGAPNAGKSSLLNLILGQDRAIVTDIPGTTRDTLEEQAHIRSIPVHLIDTAGLRESADLIERHGIARSADAIRQARVVLWIIDPARPLAAQRLDPSWLEAQALIPVLNKADLALPFTEAAELPRPPVHVSARTGVGLDDLYDAVEQAVWGTAHPEEPDVAVSARHAAHLDQAIAHLDQAIADIDAGQLELIAISLRAAIDALGRITGRTLQPDILDTIFGQFCIGK